MLDFLCSILWNFQAAVWTGVLVYLLTNLGKKNLPI
jgi:hypothetical protein